MKRWYMYCNIHAQKNMGFSMRQVSKNLGLNFHTVSKYWDMTPDEFNRIVLEPSKNTHQEVILDWLRTYPNISAAQVQDWLKEQYDLEVKNRSVRRFVEDIRKQHDIQKTKGKIRQVV